MNWYWIHIEPVLDCKLAWYCIDMEFWMRIDIALIEFHIELMLDRCWIDIELVLSFKLDWSRLPSWINMELPINFYWITNWSDIDSILYFEFGIAVELIEFEIELMLSRYYIHIELQIALISNFKLDWYWIANCIDIELILDFKSVWNFYWVSNWVSNWISNWVSNWISEWSSNRIDVDSILE